MSNYPKRTRLSAYPVHHLIGRKVVDKFNFTGKITAMTFSDVTEITVKWDTGPEQVFTLEYPSDLQVVEE